MSTGCCQYTVTFSINDFTSFCSRSEFTPTIGALQEHLLCTAAFQAYASVVRSEARVRGGKLSNFFILSNGLCQSGIQEYSMRICHMIMWP